MAIVEEESERITQCQERVEQEQLEPRLLSTPPPVVHKQDKTSPPVLQKQDEKTNDDKASQTVLCVQQVTELANENKHLRAQLSLTTFSADCLT